MATLKELTGKIAYLSKTIEGIYTEAGPDWDMAQVKGLTGDSKAKVEQLQTMNKELSALEDEARPLRALEAERRNISAMNSFYNKPVGTLSFPGDNGSPVGPAGQGKTIGQQIMEHKAEWQTPGKSISFPIELKTLFQTTAGWAPETPRVSRVELFPLRQLVVADFLPQFPVGVASFEYPEETTATLNAAEKDEAAAYAESAFVMTIRTANIRKITTSLPVTDEQLADVPAAAAYIDNRLTYDIRRRLDLQILNGTGVAPLLLGTLSVTGIQAQALAGDTVPDAIYKCFDLIRTDGFAEPSVLFIAPADWQPVRLLRTADGIYIFGSPQDAGVDRIWGKPVVQTTAVTANTAICGAYDQYAALYVKQDLEVSTGYVNDDFSKGKKTIRADIRVAVVHFRPKAFGKITGI